MDNHNIIIQCKPNQTFRPSFFSKTEETSDSELVIKRILIGTRAIIGIFERLKQFQRYLETSVFLWEAASPIEEPDAHNSLVS